MTETEVALICKAMGDAQRLRIIRMLFDSDKCASEILAELNISQPTLSHHMKILCESKLVKFKKQGKNTCYFLCCKRMHSFRQFISELECRNYGNSDCICVSSGCKGE